MFLFIQMAANQHVLLLILFISLTVFPDYTNSVGCNTVRYLNGQEVCVLDAYPSDYTQYVSWCKDVGRLPYWPMSEGDLIDMKTYLV